MTSSKEIRNLIIALIIMAIGIWFLTRIARAYIGSVPLVFADIASLLDSIGMLITLGIAFIIVILIIVYFAKRSDEKKQQKAQSRYQPKPQPQYPQPRYR